MARDLNTETVKEPQTESERANVKAIKEAIQDGLAQMYVLDAQIDAAIEAHVQKLRDKKSDIMRVLREGYHLTAPVVRAYYNLYAMERQATEASNGSVLDTIKIMFEALPFEGVVDLVKATGFTEDKRIEATAKNLKAAEKAGRDCSLRNGNMSECPHAGINKASKKLRAAWLKGYETHQKELAKKLAADKREQDRKDKAAAREAAKNAKKNGVRTEPPPPGETFDLDSTQSGAEPSTTEPVTPL